MIDGPLPGAKPTLYAYDLGKRKKTVIAEELDGYSLSADGSALLFKKSGDRTKAAAMPSSMQSRRRTTRKPIPRGSISTI